MGSDFRKIGAKKKKERTAMMEIMFQEKTGVSAHHGFITITPSIPSLIRTYSMVRFERQTELTAIFSD